MKKRPGHDKDPVYFWDTASGFLNNELPKIRRKSPNTVSAYRRSLNCFIDFLESEKSIRRETITYHDFNRNNLKEYLLYMKDACKLSEKTCNLRLTAIRSLLSYASEETTDITSIYVNAKCIKNLPVVQKPIEYFENDQTKAILNAFPEDRKLCRRNRTILILGYDAGLRVSELTSLKVSSLHLDAGTPYVTVVGKGAKYRNVPLMARTTEHLSIYLEEFHHPCDIEGPLFYTRTHGIIHPLSDDTIQKILKKAVEKAKGSVPMPESVHFHMIRKTRAMDLYQSGCPLSYIQQLLGHESISTTSGFYAFATLKTLSDAIEKANPSGNDEKKWKVEDVRKVLYRL